MNPDTWDKTMWMETETEGGVQVGLSIDTSPHVAEEASLTHDISLRMVRGCVKKATGSKATLPAFPAPYAPAGCIPPALVPPDVRREKEKSRSESCAERRRQTSSLRVKSQRVTGSTSPAAPQDQLSGSIRIIYTVRPGCCVQCKRTIISHNCGLSLVWRILKKKKLKN